MVMAMATPIRSRNRILMRITIGQGRNAKTKSITPLYATNKIRTGHNTHTIIFEHTYPQRTNCNMPQISYPNRSLGQRASTLYVKAYSSPRRQSRWPPW